MSKTEFLYHTIDPRYGQKSAASSKNGKFFVTDFFLFYFAVKPSENDEKCRKPNSFITPYDPRYGQKSAASSKNGKFFENNVTDAFITPRTRDLPAVGKFFCYFAAVKPSENNEKCRKPNSFITPMTRDMDKKVLPAVKMGNFLSPIFFFFILL